MYWWIREIIIMFKSYLRWKISILEVVSGTLADWILASVADMSWKGRYQPFDRSRGRKEIHCQSRLAPKRSNHLIFYLNDIWGEKSINNIRLHLSFTQVIHYQTKMLLNYVLKNIKICKFKSYWDWNILILGWIHRKTGKMAFLSLVDVQGLIGTTSFTGSTIKKTQCDGGMRKQLKRYTRKFNF